MRQKGSQIVFKRECTSFLRVAVSKMDDERYCPSAPSLEGAVTIHKESIALDRRLWLIFEQSCIVLVAIFFLCPIALADSGAGVVNYNPEQSSETLKNIAGAGYILLVIFYFVRLFKKRAARAVEVKLSSRDSSDTEKMKDALDRLDDGINEEEEAVEAEVSPLQCFMYVVFEICRLSFFKYIEMFYISFDHMAILVQWCGPSRNYLLSLVSCVNCS